MLLTAGPAWAGSCLKGDCRDGRGTYRWNDGSTFSGSFVAGAPDGEGEFVDKTGRKFHVLYVDGQPVSTAPVTAEEEELRLRQLEAERYNEAGIMHLRRKDFESAIFFFNKAITLRPDNPVYHQNYHKAKERKQ
jgi:tetratricopeptide (TPR) repeat protein